MIVAELHWLPYENIQAFPITCVYLNYETIIDVTHDFLTYACNRRKQANK